jgi:AraC-like DNA-binding protein
MYFLVCFVFDFNFVFKKRMLAFFIPGLFTAVIYIILAFMLKADPEVFSFSMDSLNTLIENLSLCINFIFWVMIAYQIRYVFNRRNWGMIINIAVSVYVFVALVSVALALMKLYALADIMVTVSMLYTYILAIHYPEFARFLRTEAVKAKYSKSLLEKLDKDKLAENLDLLMQTEKPYCNEELTLKTLAEQLKITQHQLSELLNLHYHESFNNFINRYRIQEALRLMELKPGFSVIDLGYEVGFSSNSAFYRAFQKETGTAPGLYKKKYEKPKN